MNIEYYYNELCIRPSDINEHLPVLRDLSKECSTIVEFGVRNVVSTFAFAVTRPNKLICVDIVKSYNVDPFLQLCASEGINVEFHESDSRTFEFESADLIFIDTLHNYSQIKAELQHFGNKSKKYLVFHDTITYGNIDEEPVEGSLKTGIVPAIKEFMRDNLQWKELVTYSNNNGLTVLVREQ